MPWGTIAVLAILAVVVGLIIFYMVRQKKSGKNSCGCGCENCPNSGCCHNQKQ